MRKHTAGEECAPLIGVDELETPYWAEGYDAAATAGLRTLLRAAPRTAALVVRWAWQVSKPLTLLAGIVQLLAGAVTAFGLLATANVLSLLLEEGPTPERVVAALPALALVIGAFALRGLLDAAVAAVAAALTPRIEQRAQDDLHAAMIEVELAAFDDADFTDLAQRAAGHGIHRVHIAARATGGLLASLVSMMAAVVTAGVLHPLLAPVVLLAAVPQGWASIRAAKLSYDSFVRMTSRTRRLDVTGDLITERRYAADVRALTAQDVLLAEHRRIATQLTVEAIAVEHRKTLVQLAGRTLSGIGTALAYVVLALLLYTEVLPLALAGAAAVAMRTASSAVSVTVYEMNTLFEAGIFLDLYLSCVVDARSRRRAEPTAQLDADPRLVELSGVVFRYPGQDRPAVDGVDLTLRRGEVVALVGQNGSGKSTLAKLITGLYLPERGRVHWDGVDTAEVAPRELHVRVGVVLQEPTQWPMTAENNVRIGRLERPDPDGAVLAGAARHSGADAVVAELADGWQTVLSRQFRGGRDVSGGQWQRFGVARGLYRDAGLVIADEPTAAMDARAEHAVFATLRGLSGNGSGRITLLVTHRLANIRHADRIVVLDHGRVTELGTHDELMDRRGTYHDLFTLQAHAYGRDAAPPDAGSTPRHGAGTAQP